MKRAGLILALLCGVGFSPKLASVNTTGLLERSYQNYSQATVVRSEQMMQGSQKAADREPDGQAYTAPVHTSSAVIIPTTAPTTAPAAAPSTTSVITPATPAQTIIPSATPAAGRVAVGRRSIPKVGGRVQTGQVGQVGTGTGVTFVTRSIQQLSHIDATQSGGGEAGPQVATDSVPTPAAIEATPVLTERVILPGELQKPSRRAIRAKQNQP